MGEGAAAKAMRALSLPVGTPLSITKTSTSGPVLGSLVHIWSAGGRADGVNVQVAMVGWWGVGA